MYYYIFESPKNYAENKIHERIKNILTVLGISGETAIVTPARNASELSIMGLEKGYSTIVAVGKDELINEVASNIYGSGAVLGIIPINASNEINNLVGSDDLKKNCEALQKRFLDSVNIGYLEPGINFLTKLTISSTKPLSVQAEINDFYFESKANEIVIDSNLNIFLRSENIKKGFFASFFSPTSDNKDSIVNSFFHANRLRLRTHEILPVKIGELAVAKTPIVAYRRPEPLKIIKYYSKIK